MATGLPALTGVPGVPDIGNVFDGVTKRGEEKVKKGAKTLERKVGIKTDTAPALLKKPGSETEVKETGQPAATSEGAVLHKPEEVIQPMDVYVTDWQFVPKGDTKVMGDFFRGMLLYKLKQSKRFDPVAVTEEERAPMKEALQKYLTHVGYAGQPKINWDAAPQYYISGKIEWINDDNCFLHGTVRNYQKQGVAIYQSKAGKCTYEEDTDFVPTEIGKMLENFREQEKTFVAQRSQVVAEEDQSVPQNSVTQSAPQISQQPVAVKKDAGSEGLTTNGLLVAGATLISPKLGAAAAVGSAIYTKASGDDDEDDDSKVAVDDHSFEVLESVDLPAQLMASNRDLVEDLALYVTKMGDPSKKPFSAVDTGNQSRFKIRFSVRQNSDGCTISADRIDLITGARLFAKREARTCEYKDIRGYMPALAQELSVEPPPLPVAQASEEDE